MIVFKKIATGHLHNDYTIGCLLDYNYFKKCYKMIAIDLSIQQALDADPKAIQQISFSRNLAGEAGEIIFSLLKKQKKLF